MRHNSRVIVALDFPDARQTIKFVEQLEAGSCKLKVGKELFTAEGPSIVETLIKKDFDVFLDLKFHDIPNTVASACRVASKLGVWMINVHALGGRRMLEAASNAIAGESHHPLLIAVTLLTSMDENDIHEVGLPGSANENVLRLASLAENSGLDGVVCSSAEVTQLRKNCRSGFQFVTPGIRPAGSDVDDQRRIMTPVEAINAGSDYLVIGRPITKSIEPMKVISDINTQLASM